MKLDIDARLIAYLEETYKVSVLDIDTMEQLHYNKGIQQVIEHLKSITEEEDEEI